MASRKNVTRRMAPVYQIKVTLEESKPPIWRRIQVPGEITLNQLHEVLQVVMGWENYHLHMFKIDGTSYTQPATDEGWSDLGEEDEDDEKAILGQVVRREKTKFIYNYDFGDGWDHKLLVEKILAPDKELRHAVCLAGERACPPEDCGGIYGYDEFLEAIRDPKHERHDELLDWIGGNFDPESFDLDRINQALKSIRLALRRRA